MLSKVPNHWCALLRWGRRTLSARGETTRVVEWSRKPVLPAVLPAFVEQNKMVSVGPILHLHMKTSFQRRFHDHRHKDTETSWAFDCFLHLWHGEIKLCGTTKPPIEHIVKKSAWFPVTVLKLASSYIRQKGDLLWEGVFCEAPYFWCIDTRLPKPTLHPPQPTHWSSQEGQWAHSS